MHSKAGTSKSKFICLLLFLIQNNFPSNDIGKTLRDQKAN